MKWLCSCLPSTSLLGAWEPSSFTIEANEYSCFVSFSSVRHSLGCTGYLQLALKEFWRPRKDLTVMNNLLTGHRLINDTADCPV